MNAKVLFVDDEQNVLDAINRMLYDADYEVLLAESGAAALSLLKSNPVQVIVSDMRMPEMNGVEFLKKSREVCPDAVRMILSGQADTASVMDAINTGGIWRFITKPWGDHEMKVTINNALDLYAKDQERKELLRELKEKNDLLNGMNDQLERKVQERTMFISKENALLTLIISGADSDVALKEACRIVGSLVGTDAVFIGKTFGEKEIFNHLDNKPDNDILAVIRQNSADKAFEAAPGIYVVPLLSSEEVLGNLVFSMASKIQAETLHGISNNIAPIITISLSMEKMALDAPELLNDLNAIMKTL